MCCLYLRLESHLSEARHKTVSFFGGHYVMSDAVQRLAGANCTGDGPRLALGSDHRQDRSEAPHATSVA